MWVCRVVEDVKANLEFFNNKIIRFPRYRLHLLFCEEKLVTVWVRVTALGIIVSIGVHCQIELLAHIGRIRGIPGVLKGGKFPDP